jgi:hypothetical protein
MKTVSGLLFSITVVSMLGCGGGGASAPNTFGGLPFVAVTRPVDAQFAQAEARSDVLTSMRARSGGKAASDNFFVAIRKSELGQRWFLTAYLKDIFPGGVQAGAGNSLGVRVVSFQIENDKLFVFNADSNTKQSDTFDPELILEAYPIVTGFAPFENAPGSRDYVLFDPAAGLNRFALVGDAFAGGRNPNQFAVQLSFLQNFRTIADGATYEHVFVGYGTVPDKNSAKGGETNQFKASGTLGIGLRRYEEGQGYSPLAMPMKNLFFRSDPHIVPNTGMSEQTAVRWNIHPGMKPIRWLMSSQFAQVAQDPQFAKYDVLGAIKRGIENWNMVFGFQALEAVMAGPDDSFADDDKNFLIFDADDSFGAAFADSRSNPNTGEQRGATVYFNKIWLELGDQQLMDDAAGPSDPNSIRVPLRPKHNAHAVPRLGWDAMPAHAPLCMMTIQDMAAAVDGTAAQPRPASVPLTKKQKVEAFLTHIVLHEVGHTLGLRHNFKGSLMPPSSSVMDYVAYDDAAHGGDVPGPYDIAAIQYLYGMSTSLPTQPFCTDEDQATDPDCQQYDQTADPLNQLYAPFYRKVRDEFLTGKGPQPNASLDAVLDYVRAATTPAQAFAAWQIALEDASVGSPVEAKALDPAKAAAIDALAGRLFQRLYIDPAAARTGNFDNDPPATNPQYTASLLAELKGNLDNVDGIRSFATRRVAVAVLKKLQTQEAMDVLYDAQVRLGPALAQVTGADAAQASELAADLTRALDPYFIAAPAPMAGPAQ